MCTYYVIMMLKRQFHFLAHFLFLCVCAQCLKNSTKHTKLKICIKMSILKYLVPQECESSRHCSSCSRYGAWSWNRHFIAIIWTTINDNNATIRIRPVFDFLQIIGSTFNYTKSFLGIHLRLYLKGITIVFNYYIPQYVFN